MICLPCKEQRHEACPGLSPTPTERKFLADRRPPTGLNEVLDDLQARTQCYCLHRTGTSGKR